MTCRVMNCCYKVLMTSSTDCGTSPLPHGACRQDDYVCGAFGGTEMNKRTTTQLFFGFGAGRYKSEKSRVIQSLKLAVLLMRQ